MAEVDYFLKLDGIEGESQAEGHAGEMQLESWSFGATNASTMGYGGGGGGGKVSVQDFTVVKTIDKGSTKLFLKCCDGTHIPKAVITGRKAGGGQKDYVKWTFDTVYVTSYQTGGAGVTPLDTVSFAFGKVEYEYKEQDEKGGLKGPVKTEWDLKKVKGA